MLRKVSVLAVSAFALGLSLSTAHANLVVDGNFNVPSGNPSFTTYSAPSSFGPWTVTQGSVDLIGDYWQSPSGPAGGSVDLDGNFQAGGISQTFNVSTPGLYNLTFALAGNPDGGDPLKTVLVTIASASQTYTFTVTNADNHSNMGYVMESLPGISLSGPATLSFTSKDDASSAFGPVIGAVNVSPVPEASTWAMMVLGFAGVGFLAYRRRGKASFRFV